MDKEFWLRQWDAKTIRTTVLHSMQWLIYPVLVGAIFCGAWGVTWLAIVLLCFLGVLVISFLWSHHHCLRTNPDLLRSERHVERKMAIERGLGDSSHGEAKSAQDLRPAAAESKPMLESGSGRGAP